MISIIPVDDSRHALWDAYVKSHDHASVYHLYAFKQAVEKTYGHKSLYFAAFDTESGSALSAYFPCLMFRVLFSAHRSCPFRFAITEGFYMTMNNMAACCMRKPFLSFMKSERPF